MTRRNFLTAAVAAAQPDSRSNIILILADDLGYGDLGCFGARDIKTPHLDKLASQGARLTQHYVCAPVCSASRAGLMTGRYPQRTGVTGVLREEHDETGLSLKEVTIADTLSKEGYRTGLVGKWHLGMPEAYRPLRRGFQSYYGTLNGTIDYNTHLSVGGGWRGRPVHFRNEEPVKEVGYFPGLMTKEAVRFIEQANPNQPFFLYYSMLLPHLPLQAPGEWIAPYKSLAGGRSTYAGMVAFMDDSIGQVMKSIDKANLASNTMVVFLSDHGWAVKQSRDTGIGSNKPFRGGKYELQEGGLRSPCIVRWPGRIKPGAAIETVTSSLDWLPTFSRAAGVRARAPNPLDGADISPALTGRKVSGERTLLWAFKDDQVRTPQSYACRRGKWKFLSVGGEESLFDLQADPGEAVNLLQKHPAEVIWMRNSLMTWRKELEAGA